MTLDILHTEASCGWGGQELRILSEAAGLIGRGHRVTLACPPEARIHGEARRRGIPVHALPIGRKSLTGLFALRRYLARNDFGVINCHSSTDSWLAALACSLLPRPPALVRTRHISAAVPNNAATRWLNTRAMRHIVTTGEKLRERLIADNGYPADRITSVPTGIDSARFHPAERTAAKRRLGLDPDCRHLGIVATLRSWKGHLYLLEAFAELQRQSSRREAWRLVIVGDGPMREVIEAKVHALALGDAVLLAGGQDAPELWLQAMDLFCLPSYANEGVPQALIQAMMTGLAVVSTPVGGIPELVTDRSTGILVPPRDARTLAAALSELIDDEALAARLGATACARARRDYAIGGMLERMERIFAAACRGHAERPIAASGKEAA